MLIVFIVITAVKLAMAAVWGWTADIPQTEAQARAFLLGGDLLDPAVTGHNPSFFPLGHYLIAAGCALASDATHLPFAFLIKVPAILADLAIASWMRTIPKTGNTGALLYLLNPVTWLLSVYHGQLHTVAVAAAWCAIWLAEERRSSWSGVVLGLATSVRQHYAPLILPLLLRGKTPRLKTLAGFALVVAAVNIPLLASRHPDRLLVPTWTYGSWGYTLILLQLPRVLAQLGIHAFARTGDTINQLLRDHGSIVYWVWTAIALAWAWRRHGRVDLWRTTLLFLLGLYAVSPGFGVQWLVWVVPFWLVVDRGAAMRYSVLAGAFLAGSYWQWTLNARYGVGSITSNLDVLSRLDLLGVLVVGLLAVVTWLYAVHAACKLASLPKG